jgi:hypothetical protein
MKNFVSVSTNAARFQDISLNPQKLAGMCAKLKCCLNYEVDDYIEAGRKLPSREVMLQTMDADYYLFKSDILAGLLTYSTDKNMAANVETITAERAKQIIEMNRRGEKPESLIEGGKPLPQKTHVELTDDDISRFDKAKKKKKKKKAQEAVPKDNKNKPKDAKEPKEAEKEAKDARAKDAKNKDSRPKDAKEPKDNRNKEAKDKENKPKDNKPSQENNDKK